jgi:hypothetical protein
MHTAKSQNRGNGFGLQAADVASATSLASSPNPAGRQADCYQRAWRRQSHSHVCNLLSATVFGSIAVAWVSNFSWRSGRTTIGIIAHSDSTVSGHGPGIVALLTGPASRIRPVFDNNANIAALYERRSLASPRRRTPLAGRTRVGIPTQPKARSGLPLDSPRRVRHLVHYS